MKRSLYFAAALAIVGAVSCNKEIVDNTTPDAPEVKLATLTATIGEPGTKTSLATPEDAHTNGSKTYWCADDRLSVFDGENNVEYSVKDSENYKASEEAVFEGEELEEAEGYYALYPYTETAELDGTTIKGAVLPAEQTAVAGNIPEGAALAVAYTEDRSEVYFKNVATTIGFTLAEAAEKVEFIAKGNENIAGTIDITFDGEGLPTYEVQAETGSNKVTLTDLAAGTYYFTILPDVTLSQGYELKINGYTAKTGAVGKKLERSQIYNIGDEPLALTPSGWYVVGNFQGWDPANGITMYEEGNYYVAKGLNIATKDSDSDKGIKFLNGKSWDKNSCGGDNVRINTQCYTSSNNIPTDGWDETYDIYLSKDASSFIIMASGNDLSNAIMISENTTGWSIVGSSEKLGNWITYHGAPFIEEGEYLVAKNITILSNDEFKFVGNSTWYRVGGNLTIDSWLSLFTNSDGNLTLNAGSYDFYIYEESKVYVTATGNTTPSAPSIQSVPVEANYLYIDATFWNPSSARFAAYFWGGVAQWRDMELVEGTEKYYKVEIPENSTNVIFARMNPETTENDFKDGVKWNKTGDLTISNENLFTISQWNDQTNGWSTVTELKL